MKKLFKIFLFPLLILPMIFCLTACEKNPSSEGEIPVYTGMEVSADMPDVLSTLSSFNPLSAEGVSNKNFHGDSKPDKDKGKEDIDKNNPLPNKPPIKDEIKSSLEIVGGEKKTYYSAPNNEVFITILLDNPDQYEIVSFTLNDKKYSSYMFEKGSDMEHLILKVDVGDTIGFKSYTIDAIKYIDKTVIKDVLMNGDKSIEIGVGQEDLVSASITNMAADLSTVSFDLNLQDEHSVINKSKGYAKAALYDGKNIFFKDINVGTQKVVFANLKPDTLYQIAIIGYYDDLLGNGKQLNTILNNAVYTESIVLFDNILIDKYSVSWEYAWFEEYENKQIYQLQLFLDGEKIQDLQPDLTSLDNLLSGRNYRLIATYKNLKNQDETIFLEFTTVATETPVVAISLIEDEDITTSSISFDLNITDVDNLGMVSKIEIVNETENYPIDLAKLTNYENITTSDLKSNTDYTIRVVYVYDANDGLGEKELIITKDVKTLDKITPIIEIVFDESDISSTDITFDINIHDLDFVGCLKYIQLHVDNEKIDEIDWIVYTDLSNLKFSYLLSNKEYSIVVCYEYDLNDGTGLHTIIESATFTTKKKYKPQVLFKLGSSAQDIRFSQLLIEVDLRDYDATNAKLESISLYLGDELISSLLPTDINADGFYEFNGLTPGRTYKVKVICAYDLNDGDKIQTSEYLYSYRTPTKSKPSVDFVNVVRTSSSISFKLSLVDKDNTNAKIIKLCYVDYETHALIGEVEIKDTTNFNNIVLTQLLPKTTYRIDVVVSYNLSDGDGDKTSRSSVAITTLAETAPIIKIEAFPSQDKITLNVTVSNPKNLVCSINRFELYQGEKFVDYIDSDGRVFSRNVLSDTKYTIKVIYGYYIDHNYQEDSEETQCITLKKETPTMDFAITETTQTGISYTLEIVDNDKTGKGVVIEVYEGNRFLTKYDVFESGTISDLLPNTQYKIMVIYYYDLNEGRGNDEIIKELEFCTLSSI